MLFDVGLLLLLVLIAQTQARKPPNTYVEGENERVVVGEASSSIYPISAAWFSHRYSQQDWKEAFKQFSKIGGDTVLLREPPLLLRAGADIKTDPDFRWCGAANSTTGAGPPDCVAEAKRELKAAGLLVDALAVYKGQEELNLLACPKYERRIASSRVYQRLVLPVNGTSSPTGCSLKAGDHVMVVFTMFAGIDTTSVLLPAANDTGMAVWLGLPGAPREPGSGLDERYLHAYSVLVQRMLKAQKDKYSQSPGLYHNVRGYFSRDEAALASDLGAGSLFPGLFKALGMAAHGVGKKLAVSVYPVLNKRLPGHAGLEDHVHGLTALASTPADVIIVQEGRGSGRSGYYWPTEEKMPVVQRDPMLHRVLSYLDPKTPHNVTFKQQFMASVNQLYSALAARRAALGAHFELWLGSEASELLRDAPCLPLDASGSGAGQLLDRAAMERLDWSIVSAGFFVQKISAFAWDSDFTCVTKNHNETLASEIEREASAWNGHPLIANCSFHSAGNMSVVVVGYDQAGLTQSFNVTYTTREGKVLSSNLHGYYFELDYGQGHGLLPSLMYTQLYDVMDPYDVALAGTVRVQAQGAATYCIFAYDYSG